MHDLPGYIGPFEDFLCHMKVHIEDSPCHMRVHAGDFAIAGRNINLRWDLMCHSWPPDNRDAVGKQ
jgi:hypothetical protein